MEGSRVKKVGLTEVTFEGKTESQVISHAANQRNNPNRGNCQCRDPEVGACLEYLKNRKEANVGGTESEYRHFLGLSGFSSSPR